MARAAREVGISYASAQAKEKGLRDSSGAAWKAKLTKEDTQEPQGPVPLDELCPEAKRALEDFAYFRQRYFGCISTPWQEDAAYKIVGWLATPIKEYLVTNAPPGSGKSTLNTLHIPAWLICRDRGIRGLTGSISSSMAERYVLQLRSALESPYPQKADHDDIERGLAVDAEATLVADFGLFKPPGAKVWSAGQFTVMQHGGRPTGAKEPTWSAWGLEAKYIGGRYDYCVWDDVMDPRGAYSLTQVESVQRDWDKVAEKRIDPGGLINLQGQRLMPTDIYRYALDKEAGESDVHPHECCAAEPGRKYHHIVYRAHDEAHCTQVHGEDAPYWPENCLLDPRRLTWRELEAEMRNDEGNFLQVYQQEDADPATTLVNMLWIKGGIDPASRQFFPGCWDEDRSICEIPKGVGQMVSVATTDPSPTKMWGVEWWCYDPDGDRHYLIDLQSRAMQAGDFFDWNHPRHEYTGLMEEWVQRAREMNRPITHWILERNIAQRFLIENDNFRNWMTTRQVQVVAHETQSNRNHPTYGVQMLANLYKFGKVRLPGKQDGVSRYLAMKLIDEVTKWRGDGRGYRNDLVMGQWMEAHHMPGIAIESLAVPALPGRPSWLTIVPSAQAS